MQTLLSNCSGHRLFHSQPCWPVLDCLHSSRALTAHGSIMWYLQPIRVQESYQITVSRAFVCIFLTKFQGVMRIQHLQAGLCSQPSSVQPNCHFPENTRCTPFWQVPWLLLGSRMSSSDHLPVQWADYWKWPLNTRIISSFIQRFSQ